MQKHKYRIGELVSLTGQFGSRRPSGVYEVVRLLPIEGGQAQYRLRSKYETTERVAREEQISSRAHEPQL